jgi:catechol 2,3-dioxygenase-like lactoylglutathione lyase family enzyme
MEQRLSCLTLGVSDLPRARAFYVDGLGWRPSFEVEDVIFFQIPGLVFGLYGGLPGDAGIEGRPAPALGTLSLSHNVRTREEVDTALAEAAAAGARPVREARDTEWGGRSGYFADPDGHLWEIAWNPFWPIGEDGATRLAAP